MFLLLFRFGNNMLDLYQKIKQNETISYQNAQIVLLSTPILPHTFIKYIIIKKSAYKEVEQELLTHELIHVNQKHSLDILFIECFQIFFWFNPFVYYLSKSIRLNHEFLADQATIKKHKDIPKYQQLLLAKANPNLMTPYASPLNYALTKKRFKMMATTSSSTSILLKKIGILPLLASLVFAFANRTMVEKEHYPRLESEHSGIEIKGFSEEHDAIDRYDIDDLDGEGHHTSENERAEH
jgi:beta-lactamase regulating signal transducer with metallopeptidase domain